MTKKALASALWATYGLAVVALWATYGLSFIGGSFYIESDEYYTLVGILMAASAIWAGIRLYKGVIN